MEIIKYQEKFKQDFIRLNVAWIEKYFAIEDADREIFNHIENEIAKGGMIYMALEEGKIIAVCMTIPENDSVWEICKLAADDEFRGLGAGSAVFKACMDYALSSGAKKLTLISHHILKPALHIYEKYGFKQVAVDRTEYARGDVQYEYIPRSLDKD